MKKIVLMVVVMIGSYATSIGQIKTTTTTTTVTTTTIEEEIPFGEAPDFVISYGNEVYNSYEYNIVNVTSVAIHISPIATPHAVILLPGATIQNVFIVETSPIYISFSLHFGRFWSHYPRIHHYHAWNVYTVSPHYNSNLRQTVRQAHRQHHRQTKRQISRRVEDRPRQLTKRLKGDNLNKYLKA